MKIKKYLIISYLKKIINLENKQMNAVIKDISDFTPRDYIQK
jgi:hypothetical protein